jgi:hypothetical protein
MTSPTQSSDLRLKTTGWIAYIPGMLRRQFVIPPKAAREFVKDMRAFFKAKDPLKQDEIAALVCWALKQHLPRGTKLRITDVKELFLQMKDHS